MSDELFLPGLPNELILTAYLSAAGNEISSGKFASPESSAALVANAFGFFLNRPEDLPPFPGTPDCGWPAKSVSLEATVRFPWAGGRHPCLDVLIATGNSLMGVESKRYEPFRPKAVGLLSEAYWRPVWGSEMEGYQRCRDDVRDGKRHFVHLDVVQLIKHAFGLRTAVHRIPEWSEKRPVLVYLYAEPKSWPLDDRPVDPGDLSRHRAEIEEFADLVKGDEVSFRSCSYLDLLASWSTQANKPLCLHSAAVLKRFLM
jgi:hypothetical protein